MKIGSECRISVRIFLDGTICYMNSNWECNIGILRGFEVAN